MSARVRSVPWFRAEPLIVDRDRSRDEWLDGLAWALREALAVTR